MPSVGTLGSINVQMYSIEVLCGLQIKYQHQSPNIEIIPRSGFDVIQPIYFPGFQKNVNSSLCSRILPIYIRKRHIFCLDFCKDDAKNSRLHISVL